MKIWRLKKGAERRLRQGHPWVFASELAHSAKEIAPGELIELRDGQDHFLAYGYGHPSSQICFRKLSGNSKDRDVLSVDFLVRRLRLARQHRRLAGWGDASHRWLFAEADGLPGLIADAFLTEGQGWIVVVQASTAGMERARENIFAAFQEFAGELGPMTFVEAPSSKSRAAEGLAIGEKRVVFGPAANLENTRLILRRGLKLGADLLHGQKTGFFLDQQANAASLRDFVTAQFQGATDPVRVLDICCYVGQWGAHTAQALTAAGRGAEVTLLDSSMAALSLAAPNVSGAGGEAKPVCGDVMKVLADFPQGSFDVVICDPPAFVKKKQDLESGLRAYAKVNQIAMKLVKPEGLLVASSCSGLVRAGDWQGVLKEASLKAGRSFKQLLTAGHAPDHPTRPEFPEGEYLKCTIGRIGYPF
jgi:23S rRNA (cytosine1962-C5)-methyltransferase